MTLRSILLVPGHASEPLAEAVAARPDAVCLDVAWRLHPSRKQEAYARAAAAAEGLSGTTAALVLLGTDTLEADVIHCVDRNVSAVVVAARTPGTVVAADVMLREQEDRLGLAHDSVKTLLLLDTPKAVWNVRALAKAGPRVAGLILGMGDLVLDLAPSADDGPAFLAGMQPRWPVPEYTFSRMATVAAAARVPLYGLLGTTLAPDSAGAARLRETCRLAMEWGFSGVVTSHIAGVRAAAEAFAGRRSIP